MMMSVRKRSRVARLRKSVKAISPTISVLLMIAIAVVASLVVYLWIMGFLNFNTARAGKAIQIQSVMYTGTHLDVYVQNVGQSSVTFTPSQCLYIDGLLRNSASVGIDRSIYLSANHGTLEQTKTASIVDNVALSLNQKVKLKVVTNDGAWIEAYFTVYTFTGDYTLSVLSVGNGHVDMVPSGQMYYYESVQLTAVHDLHWTFGDPLWNGSLSGNANPQQILMDGNKAVTATFLPVTHQITFAQTGVSSDFKGDVVTVEGTGYKVGDLPHTFTWNEGDPYSFGFASPLVVSTGKEYNWSSTSGLSTLQSGNFVPDQDGTITGNFETRFNVTVLASAAGATGGTFTVTYTQSGTVHQDEAQSTSWSEWVDSNTDVAVSQPQQYIPSDTGAGGVRYVFTGYDPTPSVTMTDAQTITLNYKVQYQITFAIASTDPPLPPDTGTTVPAPGTDWYDGGSPGLSISADLINHNWIFSYWGADTGIMIDNASSTSTTATFNGPGTITAYFSLHIVGITIDTTPLEPLFIKVDGAQISTPQTFPWVIGDTHTLEAVSPQGGGQNTQYVWTGWSDSGDQIHDYTVPNHPESVVASYKTQYYLTVTSPYAETYGEGYYDANAYAVAAVSTDTVDDGAGTRHLFAGWSGDAAGTVTTSYPILMDGPKTAVANWYTQYYLTVTSAQDTPIPTSGWFNASTAISASVTSPWNQVGQSRYNCSGWTGTGSVPATGSRPSVNFAINLPSSITWNWNQQYQVTFQVNPANNGTTTPSGTNWYDAGTNVPIRAIDSSTSDSFVFCFWNVSSPSLVIANSSAASTTATINGAGTITANFRIPTAIYWVTWPNPIEYGDPATIVGILTPAPTIFPQITLVLKAPNGTQYTPSYYTLAGLFYISATPDTAGTWTVSARFDGNSYYNASSVGPTNFVVTKTTASITCTVSPTTLTPGQQLTVSGSLTPGNGPDLQGKTLTLTFTKPDHSTFTDTTVTGASGSYTYHYTPSDLGSWSVVVSWPGDANHQAATGPTQTFTVANPVSITITSSQTGSGYVTVDGNAITTPTTFSWVPGTTHSLQANSPVSGVSGIRYVYTGWSDSGAQTHTYTVPSSGATVTANFKTQYQLTVTSAHDSPNPSGSSNWYDSGTSVTASVTSPADQSGGTRYRCSGWSGTGSVSSSGTGTSTTFTISASSTITWNWIVQYQVTFAIGSGSGSTTPAVGTNWCDGGIAVSILATANSGYGFSSWTATGPVTIATPSAASTTATITGEGGTITANFALAATETLYPTSVTFSSGSAAGDPISNMQSDNSVYYRATAGLLSSLDYYGEFTASASAGKTKTSLTVTLDGYYSAGKTQTIYVYNFATSSWTQFDSSSMSSGNKALRTFTISSGVSNYVNAQNRIRVRITANAGILGFTHYNDYFRVDAVYIP